MKLILTEVAPLERDPNDPENTSGIGITVSEPGMSEQQQSLCMLYALYGVLPQWPEHSGKLPITGE